MQEKQFIKRMAQLALAWTVPPLLLTLMIVSRTPEKESFWEGLRFFGFQLVLWYPWILWNLLGWRLLKRWPLTKGQKIKHLAWHLLVATLLALFMNVFQILLELWQSYSFLGALREVTQNHLAQVYSPVRLLMNALLYGVVLILGMVLQLMKQNQEQRLQMAHDRLQMLTHQLQPHFLFNTLNAIATLMEEDIAGARTMIARLGDLLRASLSHGEDQEISLSDELAILQCYLSIQGVRFSDRLKVEIDVDPLITEALVPPLILQPLVENAIHHGMGPKGGKVTIQARPKGEKLQLIVRDNGPGFRSERDEGIGLANCRDRLAVLYGAAAELTYQNRAEGGAHVEIVIPKFLPRTESIPP